MKPICNTFLIKCFIYWLLYIIKRIFTYYKSVYFLEWYEKFLIIEQKKTWVIIYYFDFNVENLNRLKDSVCIVLQKIFGVSLTDSVLFTKIAELVSVRKNHLTFV